MAHPTVAQFYNNIAASRPLCVLPIASPPFAADAPNRSVSTPVRRINPLAYIPEFSPLLSKLQRIFGRVAPLLPIGSALPPGAIAPAHPLRPSSPPPQAIFPMFNPPNPAPAVPRLPLITSAAAIAWEALLRQSATAFIANGAGDMAVFVDQARDLIASAMAPAEDEVMDEGEDTEVESVAGGVSRSVSLASVGEGEGKKRKRKRRRRVGG